MKRKTFGFFGTEAVNHKDCDHSSTACRSLCPSWQDRCKTVWWMILHSLHCQLQQYNCDVRILKPSERTSQDRRTEARVDNTAPDLRHQVSRRMGYGQWLPLHRSWNYFSLKTCEVHVRCRQGDEKSRFVSANRAKRSQIGEFEDKENLREVIVLYSCKQLRLHFSHVSRRHVKKDMFHCHAPWQPLNKPKMWGDNLKKHNIG